MRTLAYCTEAAELAVSKALGVIPLTSPPLQASQFPVRKLHNLDMLYFRLHSMAQGQWYGEGKDGTRPIAFVARNLAKANLTGCVALVANCYGTEDVLMNALLRAGAKTVITGPGPNYGAARIVTGADLLARWLWFGLRIGLRPQVALWMAKIRLRMDLRQLRTELGGLVSASKDALAFEIVGGVT